jgi:oligosaccharyltransferase complex subunit delta (ribophorin II)
LRTFEILGIEKRPDIGSTSCQSVSETLGSSTSDLKDLFHALKVNSILKCKVNEEIFQVF